MSDHKHTVRLRAHHLLCMHGFQGKGYSDLFVRRLREIIDRLNDELGIRVWVADDPMTSVARGAGAILESEESLEQFRASVDRFSNPR